MASPAEVSITAGGPRLGELARRRIEHLERRWSRFLADSDITRLNLAGGEPVRVHTDTITLVEAMIDGWVATQGAFDPTVLAGMIRIGHAVSHDDPSRVTVLPGGCARLGDLLGIEIDRPASTVRLPRGTALDPGAIGKGLAADLTVSALIEHGARGALINLGGDISAGGEPGDGDAWHVAIADPYDDQADIARVALAGGGVATSGITRRRLVDRYGVAHHHLLDPRRGRAPEHSLIQASVVAGTAAWAEVLATELMVGGPAVLDHLDGAALAVDPAGRAMRNARWAVYEVPAGEVRR